MALVSTILKDALTDIGAYGQEDTLEATDAQRALRIFQNQIDAWAADRLTLAIQSRQAISWTSGNSSQTIGPTGADTTAQRPVYITQLNYVVPGSSPAVEVVIAPMDDEAYAAQSIKDLSSGLPLSYFFQTSLTTTLGEVTLWPVPNQDLTLYLYASQSVAIPVALTDSIIGPPGYAEAFLYQLEERLLHPYSVLDPAIVSRVLSLSAMAYDRLKRTNTHPPLLGVDAALVPSNGGAYNIETDSQSGFSR